MPVLTCLSQLPPLRPECRLIVTLPAKDEADYITAALGALADQFTLTGQRLSPDTYEVILLANNCTDATVTIASEFARCHPRLMLHVCRYTFPPETAGVGAARKLMMNAAAARLPDDGIICTTDADTQVDPHWVAATFRAFDHGARAVGGRIVVPAGSRTKYRKTHLQDVTYRSLLMLLESIIDPSKEDPWPRHFQNFGPSTAVRVDAYRACGGIPPLKCIEDVALARALERVDVCFVHDPAVKVYTSDRRSDRVEGVTFSQQLDLWTRLANGEVEQRVAGLDNSIRLFKWKVALRQAFSERRLIASPVLYQLAAYIDTTPTALEARIVTASSFGCLYQDIRDTVEALPKYSDTPFEKAIKELRRFTRSARCCPSFSKRRAGSVPSARPYSGSRHSTFA